MRAVVLLLLAALAGAQGRELLEGGVDAAILNGHAAKRGRWDYIAQLRYPWYDNQGIARNNFTCQGVLIRPDIVLTSAQCVPDSGVWPIVKIGAYQTQGRAIATRRVIATAWHAGYLKQATVLNIVDNVALMQLDKPVRSVPLIRVPKSDPSPAAIVGENMCILGYGATSAAAGAPILATNLMKGSQNRMSQKMCDRTWGNFIVPCTRDCDTTSSWGSKKYMCTNNEKTDQALCWYDGGAPLIRYSSRGAGDDTIIGVGAYTECQGRGPRAGSVFANIAKYSAWIDRGVSLLRKGIAKSTGAYRIAASKNYPPQRGCTAVGRRCESRPVTSGADTDTCCVGSCVLGACLPFTP